MTGGSRPDWHKQIWACVAGIPAGRVATYGQIARLAGLPGYARQVGMVLKKLPQHSSLPWHRVINAKGQISFAEGSSAYQSQLGKLQQENVVVIAGRVNLRQFQWQP